MIGTADEIGAKDQENLSNVFKNADKAVELNDLVIVATDIGAKDKENLGSVFKNADKSREFKKKIVVKC